ncbi:MAG: ATP-binding protein [Cytophagales bacterium]|nr:ATP-binding protein [Cytophagales bacterium]
MSWIGRYTEEEILKKKVTKGKVFVLYGPRRTGKTSMIRHFIENHSGRIFSGTGDDLPLREILSSQSVKTITSAFQNYDLVFIDEAQRIPEIGLGLKILVDALPELKIIVTGSSSFELSGQLGEPLTGRQHVSILYPLSSLELAAQFGNYHLYETLNDHLIYGSYPEVVTTDDLAEKQEYLVSLRDSYLFKDILELENLKNSVKLTELLKLLAFQIGNEVSLSELSNALGIARQTVERYLDLLEKVFIIKRIGGFSRNLRKEVVKTARYYFFDNGVRNSLISNFNDVNTRMDMGMLWENFCVMERLKKQEYHAIYANNYFWRTYDRQEIDFVEEREGKLFGYEFKWNSRKKVNPPKAWRSTYTDASFECITPKNFLEFVI